MSELTKQAQTLLDECKRLEPGLAEVCADETTETKVVFENTDFSVATSSTAAVLGLRVIVNNKLGFITTNNLNTEDLKEKAREAQMVARLSPASSFHDIPHTKSGEKNFSITDTKLEKASPKDLLQWTELFVEEAKKDKRVTLDRAELSLGTINHLVQNSEGVRQELKQTLCSFHIMGMAKEGNEVTSFDYDGDSCAHYKDVEGRIKNTAKEFRESVIGCLGASTANSYRGPVLFHPAAVGSLIAGLVGFNVNARAQQDGMSQWAKGLGTQVAADIFSMYEDPMDQTRPASWSPFDREGVLCTRHDIIKDGVLNFTAHNSFTAKRASTQATGNATGGARSVPSIGLHALTIRPGKATQDELYSALNAGLVLKRFSGNSDPTSGQFSGVAKNSWWVQNGKRSHALKEVMISGNMFDLLKNIKLVGGQIFRQSGSFDSPYILIDGVSVTSA